MYACIYVPIYVSVYVYIYITVCLSICLSNFNNLPIYLVFLCMYVTLSLFNYLSICLIICLSIHPSVCVYLSVSIFFIYLCLYLIYLLILSVCMSIYLFNYCVLNRILYEFLYWIQWAYQAIQSNMYTSDSCGDEKVRGKMRRRRRRLYCMLQAGTHTQTHMGLLHDKSFPLLLPPPFPPSSHTQLRRSHWVHPFWQPRYSDVYPSEK